MVKIYSIENCRYCTELKEILINEGVPFTEIDVNLPENDAEYQKLIEITQCENVPQIKVGNQILIPDISFRSIREAADLTKKFLV